jgi:hypothetical protein
MCALHAGAVELSWQRTAAVGTPARRPWRITQAHGDLGGDPVERLLERVAVVKGAAGVQALVDREGDQQKNRNPESYEGSAIDAGTSSGRTSGAREQSERRQEDERLAGHLGGVS